jgi:two-component sensor histidine kinase/DNA-binding NarL/FixJ family response regulator
MKIMTGLKVLLIEDNPGDARLIQEMLSEVDGSMFELESADCLSTGLERLAAEDIDVVLLDLGLPDSSGLDTFIKTHAQAPDVPIMMFTGLDDAELAIKAVQEGAQDYLPKNKLDSELLKHLNSVLKAIRGVNQLIVMEKDSDTLLQKVCNTLTEARGYDAAWLGFLSDDEAFATVKGSGFSEEVARFCEQVMGGDLPPCIRKALVQKNPLLIVDKPLECGDCFFKDVCVGKEAAIIRVEHANRFFGLLAVLLAPDVTIDEEEKGILEEVAGDIAFGLYDMEVEEARKRAEDQIEASLKEKEVLLREIHHRVKNNLQVVSSLLNMQARAAKDKDTIDILSESRNRINTMALIHSQLYESGNLSAINMKGFVDNMLRQLVQSYPVQDTKITQIVQGDDYPFPISVAVPVGLIVNELLSNAFKHAFVNRKEGKIEVSFGASEEGGVSLAISDDGVGLPNGFDINKSKTLGLRLVKILAEDQLQGKLEVISKEGTTFNIEFDIEKIEGS